MGTHIIIHVPPHVFYYRWRRYFLRTSSLQFLYADLNTCCFLLLTKTIYPRVVIEKYASITSRTYFHCDWAKASALEAKGYFAVTSYMETCYQLFQIHKCTKFWYCMYIFLSCIHIWKITNAIFFTSCISSPQNITTFSQFVSYFHRHHLCMPCCSVFPIIRHSCLLIFLIFVFLGIYL